MKKRILCLLAAALLALSGCGGESVPPRVMPDDPGFVPYQAPAFAASAFHPEAAERSGTVQLDLSALAEGYVAVSAESARRLKFQAIQGEITYNYDLSGDGTPSVFPLQSGDGTYRFRVMENVEENKYAEIYSAEAEVQLADEFQPFLRPSDYVPYDENSQCVAKAAELAKSASTALDVVAAVYECVCSNVTYDREKAMTVQSGYLPDPDETLRTGQGICFDYAALAAAMLRSQGIPTKMIFGMVGPEGLYHAWNMFYTAETGWVTVGFQVDEKTWNRLDLTFSAGGESAEFIGNGENYADLYQY